MGWKEKFQIAPVKENAVNSVELIDRERLIMNPLIVLLIGMLIVFIGLICIVFIVKLMTLVCSCFGKKKNDDAKDKPQEHTGSVASSPKTAFIPMSSEERQKLIVAVSVALGSVMGTDGIRITSIRRLKQHLGTTACTAAYDRRELVAAISAAIAESAGLNSDSFRITSIKKLS